MLAAISHDIVLATETCCNCSVAFAMPTEMMDRLRTNGGSFYCPNGHSQHYTKTEVQRLRTELNKANKDAQYWRQRKVEEEAARQHAERQAAARKGLVTKIKNRISNGVCPCCNRTFTDLQRHMESKHPDYAVSG